MVNAVTNGPSSGASGPKQPDQKNYSDMTPAELENLLKDPKTTPKQKHKIEQELIKQEIKQAEQDQQHGVPGAAEDLKQLQDIQTKMQNGTALSAQDTQLLERLGIDPSTFGN